MQDQATNQVMGYVQVAVVPDNTIHMKAISFKQATDISIMVMVVMVMVMVVKVDVA